MSYKIDNFQINTTLREIYLNKELLVIEPKVYEVIIFFIENANKAISKDELQDAIWPNVEVSETAITRAVMKARKALNDESNPQNYIQTIHGHGYKFIADITVIEKEPESKTTSKTNIDEVQTSLFRSISVKTTLLILTLLSFIGIGLVYLNQETPEEISHHRLMVLPVSNKIEDESYSWVSLGLMSLASKVIESGTHISLLADSESAKSTEILESDTFPISQEQLLKLKQRFNADYIISSVLTQHNEKLYVLRYSVYHPKGVYSEVKIEGDNPSGLAQKMAKQITQLLPGQVTTAIENVVSEDDFTNELYSRGMSYQIQGYADKAEKYFELAIEQDPTLIAAKIELAIVKRKLSNYQGSIDDLQNLLQNLDQFPQDPTNELEINNSLGVAYFRQRDFKEATHYYLKSYELAKKLNNHKFLIKTSLNMGIVEKNLGHYDNARKWVTEALTISRKHNNTDDPTAIYLLGQIERELQNTDKAISLFSQAYDQFNKNQEYREATSVMNAHAMLLAKKGRYSEALERLNESLEFKLKLNDGIGIIDNKLYMTDVYLETEDIPALERVYGELQQYIAETKINSRNFEMTKLGIYIDFLKNDYQTTLDKIAKLPDDFNSRSIDMVLMKCKQKLGDKDIIKVWLDEFSYLKSGEDSRMRMYWLDLENFYLESYGSTLELQESYKQRLRLSRAMGNDAASANILLKIGQQHIQNDQLSEASDTLNELKIMNLDWWQIDLFEAEIMNANGQVNQSIELAKSAKQKASSIWGDKEEARLQKLLSNSLN
jgi:DNA-binding winged helix-turn-helix (wHTH) protein/tetratricopeptide (TPR) repeat protein